MCKASETYVLKLATSWPNNREQHLLSKCLGHRPEEVPINRREGKVCWKGMMHDLGIIWNNWQYCNECACLAKTWTQEMLVCIERVRVCFPLCPSFSNLPWTTEKLRRRLRQNYWMEEVDHQSCHLWSHEQTCTDRLHLHESSVSDCRVDARKSLRPYHFLTVASVICQPLWGLYSALEHPIIRLTIFCHSRCLQPMILRSPVS